MTSLTSLALVLAISAFPLGNINQFHSTARPSINQDPVEENIGQLFALDLVGGGRGGGLGRGGGGNRGGGNSGGGQSRGGGGNSGGGSRGGGLGRSGGGNSGGGQSRGGNGNSGPFSRGGTLGRNGNYTPAGNSNMRGNSGTLVRPNGRNALSVNRAPVGLNQWSPHPGLTPYKSNHDITQIHGLGRSIDITQAPYVNPRNGNLATLIQQQNQTRIARNWRNGYYYYPYNGFSDDYFFFSGYAFNPYNTPCYVSPWYYYSCLPPYIDCDDTVIFFTPFFGSFSGDNYQYVGGSFGSSSDFSRYAQTGSNNSDIPSLDNALNDLEDAFMKRDNNALQRIVPSSGNIPIFIDGKYNYSVTTNDLYGMLRDNAQSVETTNYQIDNVKVNGRMARVLAEQDFVDAWGNHQVVYQEFMFKIVGNEALITEFGTSKNRPWN